MTEGTDKKKLISETFLQLLKTHPGDKISVKQIVDECGLSRQTFYYHFQDIMDVVEYTLKSILDDTVSICNGTDDPKEAIRLFLEVVEQNRWMMKRLENTSRSKEYERYATEGLGRVMKEFLNRMPSNLELLSSGDLDFVISLLSHGVVGIINDHIRREEALDTEKTADRLYRIYTGNILLISG